MIGSGCRSRSGRGGRTGNRLGRTATNSIAFLLLTLCLEQHAKADHLCSACVAIGPPRRFAAMRDDDRSRTYRVGVHRLWHRLSLLDALRSSSAWRSSLHLTHCRSGDTRARHCHQRPLRASCRHVRARRIDRPVLAASPVSAVRITAAKSASGVSRPGPWEGLGKQISHGLGRRLAMHHIVSSGSVTPNRAPPLANSISVALSSWRFSRSTTKPLITKFHRCAGTLSCTSRLRLAAGPLAVEVTWPSD